MSIMKPLNLKDLPDDIEALKKIVFEANQIIEKSHESNDQKDETIKELKWLNQGLQIQLEKHLRHRLGSKSEKGSPGQM